MRLSFVPEEDTDWEFREALRREETDVEEVLLEEEEEEEVSDYGKLWWNFGTRDSYWSRTNFDLKRRILWGGGRKVG